jgi:regulator of sigma E protease
MVILVIATTPASNIIHNFVDGSTSNNYGLQVNDRIVAVNGVYTHSGSEVAYEVTYQGDKPLDITVIRDGEKIILTNIQFPKIEENGVTLGVYDFQFYMADKDLATIISHSFWRSVSTIKMVWDSIADLIKGRYGLDAVSGPIGMTELVGSALSTGWQSLLYLLVIISINLGIMNLLPVPALDGGRLIFLLWEAITRKPVNKQIEAYINGVGLLILMGFMLLITMKDIITII